MREVTFVNFYKLRDILGFGRGEADVVIPGRFAALFGSLLRRCKTTCQSQLNGPNSERHLTPKGR
jgi:hypothetical protein